MKELGQLGFISGQLGSLSGLYSDKTLNFGLSPPPLNPLLSRPPYVGFGSFGQQGCRPGTGSRSTVQVCVFMSLSFYNIYMYIYYINEQISMLMISK